MNFLFSILNFEINALGRCSISEQRLVGFTSCEFWKFGTLGVRNYACVGVERKLGDGIKHVGIRSVNADMRNVETRHAPRAKASLNSKNS